MKLQMESALCRELTSPEKDGPNGSRIRIPFEWESSSFARRKHELDNLNTNQVLKPVQRLRLDQVTEDPVDKCKNPPPKDAPMWTISKRFR